MMKIITIALFLLKCLGVAGFVPAPTTKKNHHAATEVGSEFTLSMISSFFPSLQKQESTKDNENGRDEEYPWLFTGRLWFRPAIVRVEDSNTDSLDDTGIVSILSLFGYTIGGTVALEYDESPVGPYREYVSMGALVACSKGGMVGQWGSRLYVSNKQAEVICQDVWGVPAEVANIDFIEETNSLQVRSAPDPLSITKTSCPNIEVTGWSKTRVNNENSPVRGGLPILWTPTIKALWAKLLPLTLNKDSQNNGLPVHKLRLSASSVSLQFCSQQPSDLLGIPLPIGLSVDNVLIEIGRKDGWL